MKGHKLSYEFQRKGGSQSQKRFVVFIMGFIILLDACVGIRVAQAKGPVVLTFWTFFGGGEGYIMTNLIKQFNSEHTDIRVEEQQVDWGQYYNKILAAVVGGNPPDLAMMHMSSLPDYVLRGALCSLNDYVSEDLKKDYLENIISSATYNGQIYALPLDTHTIILYYNRAVLREAGLVDNSGNVILPKNTDEFYEECRKVKEKTGKYGFVSETSPMMGERWWMSLYTQLGGKFFDDQGNFIIEKDKAISAYKEMLRFFESGLAPNSIAYDSQKALFISDEAAFTIDGVWDMAVFPDSEGLDFGVTLLPPIAGAKPYVWADSHTIVLPKKSKMDEGKMKASVTFASWLINHSAEWAKAGHIPVIKSVRNSQDFLNLPLRKDYMAAAENVVLPPKVRGWTELKDKLSEVGQAVWPGAMTPEQAAEEIASVASRIASKV